MMVLAGRCRVARNLRANVRDWRRSICSRAAISSRDTDFRTRAERTGPRTIWGANDLKIPVFSRIQAGAHAGLLRSIARRFPRRRFATT